jgi:RAB protein geranylgeranyltransferase component A
MADASAGGFPEDYPTIDPTSFDVVVCGTGLPESILAAACAAAGKTVLHVDPNPFYGSLYSSVPLPSLPSFLSSDSSTPVPSSSTATTSSTAAAASHSAVHLERRCLYSEVETSGTVPESSGRFTVDLVGPRVLYCADEAVDLLLRSGGNNHVEFKSVDGGSLLYRDGALYPVPDNKGAIFMDETLKLGMKTLLFSFFKLVESHIAASSSGDKEGEGEASAKISEEDLNLPFIEFLKKQRLPPKIRA